MIIPDINLLLYSYDSGSAFHAKAASWWQGCMSGTEPVGLPHVVLFGFVRIGTSARAFQHPMTPAEAAGYVRSWLGTAGNLVSDAQMAAAALAHDAVLHTADTDFVRFQGLRWHNPLTGVGSAGLRRSKPS